MAYKTTLKDITGKLENPELEAVPTQALADMGYVPVGGGGTSTPTVDKSSTGTGQQQYSRMGNTSKMTEFEMMYGYDPFKSRDKSQDKGKFESMVGEAPSEEQIRSGKLSSAQAQIDAIRAQFAKTLEAEQMAGSGREARTRALNISGGLAGSDFASTAAIKTEDFNKAQMQMRRDERDAMINKILSDVESETEETFTQRRSQFLQDFESSVDADRAFIEEQQGKALGRFQALAKSGADIEKMKQAEPDVYQKLQKQSGLSDFEISAYFNEQKPPAEKIDWDKRTIGDTLVWSGVDPLTGELKVMQQEIGKGVKDLQIIGGKPYNVFENEDGTLRLEQAQGFVEEQPSELDILEQKQQIQKNEMEMDKLNKEIEQIGKEDPINSKIKYEQWLALKQKNNQAQAKEDKVNIESGKAVSVFESKIKEIENLMTSSGLEDAVGTGIGLFSRSSLDEWWTGDKSNFIAGVNQLLSQETMDTLTALKDRGGTLGALSDQERIMLSNAASKIGSWAIKDENGNIVGFGAKGNDFKEELKKIKDKTQELLDAAREELGTGFEGEANIDTGGFDEEVVFSE